MTVLVDLKSFTLNYFLQPPQYYFIFCSFLVEAGVVCHHVFEVDAFLEMVLDTPVKLKLMLKN